MKHCLYSFLRRLALPGLMSLILLSPALARADTITTFLVSGGASNISGFALGDCPRFATCPFSGLFQVDTTNDTVESSGFEFTFPGLTALDTLIASQPVAGGTFWQIGASNGNPFDTLALDFITAPNHQSLVDFTGSSTVAGGITNVYDIRNGSITPVPEPSSLVLLTGGIGWLVFGRLIRKVH